MTHESKRSVMRVILTSATIAAILGPVAAAQAAVVTFVTPTTISADSNVYTAGALAYAFDWANSTATVNGVSFTGTNNSGGSPSGTDVGFAGSPPWVVP